MDGINCDFTPMNEAQKGEAWEKVVHFGLENGIDIKKHLGIPEFLRFRPYLYPGIGLNEEWYLLYVFMEEPAHMYMKTRRRFKIGPYNHVPSETEFRLLNKTNSIIHYKPRV